MSRQEVEAVLAHEVAHAANGDMVTLTLIQGVVNTFVFFLARVFGWRAWTRAAIVDPQFIAGVRKKLQLDRREAAQLFGGG